MVRTATLDLNSRGSFVDDLNSIPGIVMCRDALLHRSHEIQPAFFDQELKFIKLDFIFIFFALLRTSLGFTKTVLLWILYKSESVRLKEFPTCYKKLINSTY